MNFLNNKSIQLEYEDDIATLNYVLNDSITNPIESKKYENNTFIDWYIETMNIPTASKFISKKWLSLILTAIISGYIVTLIDLSSVWLNDLRKGLCFSKLDKWSLLNPYLTCPVDDWYDWSEIFFNSSKTVTSVFVNFPIYVILGSILVITTVYISEKDLYIQQSGIPEVKEIIQGFNYDITTYLGLKTLCFKILGLIFMVSSGFWLGKEGPLVHVSCCILNVLYTFIFGSQSNEAVRRELLSAATATGISLAFNSPIGGVLFVLECIPSFFMPTKIMWNSFISATVSLIVLVGFKLLTEGENFDEKDLFLVEFGNFSWLIMEIIPFIGLGIMGAFYGSFFIKLYSKFLSNNFRNILQNKFCQVLKINAKYGNYIEILLIFLITSILNYPLTMTRLPLSAFLKILFKNCDIDSNNNNTNNTDNSNSTNFMCGSSDWITLIKLGYIAIQAFFLSAYTFGTILPGGVLMPSLVIGAVCGRLVGILSSFIQLNLFGELEFCTTNSCLVSPSSYAVIGAGAFMTGITKLTMCVVVILFELSGAVSYVLPIMIGVMVLKFVSDSLVNENIYDAWLKNNFNKPTGDSGLSHSVQGFYNENKGNGLCHYSNSTPNVRNSLPNIDISKVMVPVSHTKVLYLVPSEAYTLQQLHSILNDDNHEGYPMLVSEYQPVSLGYIHKQKIYSALTMIELATSDSVISFQIHDTPSEFLSQQISFEQNLDNSNLIKLDIIPEKPFIIMNDRTSFRLLIDVFEKMYLNYLIINSSTNGTPNTMSGFIDRFMMAKLIDEGFKSLHDELINDYEYIQEFDIDNENYEEHGIGEALINGRERPSIELIT